MKKITFECMQKTQTKIGVSKRHMLTSFLSKGVKKGSLTLSPETIVNIGSRQLKIAPKISILPNLGSTGSIDKCFPENDKQ
jgi:hypothetical protein